MFNQTLFADKKCVAVALSGGKDSVFLLHLLLQKRQELNITVKAINVEHGIRGENSERDSAFVTNLCATWQVELKSYCVNAPKYSQDNSLSIENAARILRYECFDNAVIDGFCDCVATAHHQSDNAETVLLNFLRGTSLSGLTGIPTSNRNNTIIRPILGVSKSDIDDYVKKNNLPYVTDETNFSNDYSRNFLRNEVIPLIKQKFPSFDQTTERLSQISKQENDFLNKSSSSLVIDNSVLITTDENEVLFKRACVIAFKNAGFCVDYEKAHVDALWNLTKSETGSKINLKSPFIAYKSYDRIVIERIKSYSLLQIPFTLGTISFGDYELSFEKCEAISRLTTQNALFFDADKLPKNACIRFRQTGDKITAFGGKNKTLKKYLTDKKIESRVSQRLPLVASDDEIYAVTGVDVSDKIKIDEKTVNIIKFTFKYKEQQQNG